MPRLTVALSPLLVLAALLPAPAVAGSGPWTLGPREHNAYVGGDYYRFGNFNGAGPEAQDLFTGVTAAGLTGVWTTGMAWGLELELKASFESVRVNEPAASGCTNASRPGDWCEPTAGPGDFAGTLKWRFVDESYAAPFSASLGVAFRTGEAYANVRRRLTTLGDGQTDAGAALSIGRTATVWRGWYTLSATAWYWYRFPNVPADDAGGKAPRDEVGWEAEGMVSVHPRFAFGPAVYGFARLGGEALADADYMDHDVWNRLRASQIKVGAKIGVYATDGGPTFSLAVLRTVVARNNPADTVAISAGIGWFLQPGRKPET